MFYIYIDYIPVAGCVKLQCTPYTNWPCYKIYKIITYHIITSSKKKNSKNKNISLIIEHIIIGIMVKKMYYISSHFVSNNNTFSLFAITCVFQFSAKNWPTAIPTSKWRWLLSLQHKSHLYSPWKIKKNLLV